MQQMWTGFIFWSSRHTYRTAVSGSSTSIWLFFELSVAVLISTRSKLCSKSSLYERKSPAWRYNIQSFFKISVHVRNGDATMYFSKAHLDQEISHLSSSSTTPDQRASSLQTTYCGSALPFSDNLSSKIWSYIVLFLNTWFLLSPVHDLLHLICGSPVGRKIHLLRWDWSLDAHRSRHYESQRALRQLIYFL